MREVSEVYKKGTSLLLANQNPGIIDETARSKAMDYPAKTCPHCKVQLQPSEGAFELMKMGAVSTESSPGLPISLCSCPQCGYIELYNLKVVGRI